MKKITRIDPEFVIDISDVMKTAKQGMSIEDFFYLKEYQERKHFITDAIDAVSTDDLCKAILQYNRDDAGIAPEDREPIRIYLDTPGGDVSAGLRVIDVIRASITPVHIINLGICYSMGFMIFIAGHKRFASENATFLMHDGSVSASGSASKTRDLMEFNDRVDGRLRSLVLGMTSISDEMYDAKIRKEWYMFADEAKELGVVDSILGIDCGIGDII